MREGNSSYPQLPTLISNVLSERSCSEMKSLADSFGVSHCNKKHCACVLVAQSCLTL